MAVSIRVKQKKTAPQVENEPSARELQREERLREKYGELLSLDALVEALGAKSCDSIRKACANGRLPIELIRVPFRRGVFASVRDVAHAMETLKDWSQPVHRSGEKGEQ
jgi:hypothetical protein